MATKKTKASARAVDHNAEIREAIFKIERAQTEISAGFAVSAVGLVHLRDAQEALSEAASRLRDLLPGTAGDSTKAKPRRSSSSRAGKVSARRKHVVRSVPPLPLDHSQQRKVVNRKRLSGQPSREDFQNNDDLPF